MKWLASWVVSTGLVLAASSTNAQMSTPYAGGQAHYQAASDFEGPYGGAPPGPMPAPPLPPYGYQPNYGYGPQYGYGPALIPMPEVYTVLRSNGFSPLGVPHQRGFVYVISAIDRTGQDGQVMIDGRSGQIIRFMPAYR